jgi:MoxR-like ATPase
MRRSSPCTTRNLEQLLDQVLIKFYWLREQSELRKKPSTSELIDWIAAAPRSGISPTDSSCTSRSRRAAQERAGHRGARQVPRPRRLDRAVDDRLVQQVGARAEAAARRCSSYERSRKSSMNTPVSASRPMSAIMPTHTAIETL